LLAPGLVGVTDTLSGPEVGVSSFAWLFVQTLIYGVVFLRFRFAVIVSSFVDVVFVRSVISSDRRISPWASVYQPVGLCSCSLASPRGRRLVGPRASVGSDWYSQSPMELPRGLQQLSCPFVEHAISMFWRFHAVWKGSVFYSCFWFLHGSRMQL
jgi:hypothetical protein